MTIASFGRITPLQGDMLLLVGFGPSKHDGVRDLEMPAEFHGIVGNLRKGRDALEKQRDKIFHTACKLGIIF